MHLPVLLQEVIDGLALSPNTHCIDGTVGLGGHAEAILERTVPNGRLIGFDRDRSNLLLAEERLEPFGDRFIGIHDSYANVLHHQQVIDSVGAVGAILLDLGVSSIHVDNPERGFSFRADGPLDMRFDQSHGATAADLLNSQPEEELRMLFKEYGEERAAAKVARAIVQRRTETPFHSTADLAELVERVVGRRPGQKIHPATRVFQALRIAVNNELDQLQQFIPAAIDLLATGGRIAIISFHSLEDRIVKHTFKEASLDCVCPPELPECRCDHPAKLTLITRSPITATEEEIATNPRSRSAKLRIAQKI